MKLSAFVVSSILVVIVVLLFAPGAAAQTVTGTHSRQTECFCGGQEGTGIPFCFENAPCTDLTPCATGADCAAGEQCLDADNFCFQAVCVSVCDSLPCTNPGDTAHGFELCLDQAPTMGQWGLITLAALLLLGGALMLRMNGRTARAAIVLVALSVLTGAWAYTSIQANPECGSAESSVLADAGR